MNQDEEHLNRLSIFHYIVGVITMLFSSVFLIHVALGVGIVAGKLPFDTTPSKPDPTGWLFVVIGSVVVLAGWTAGILIIVAGRKLRARSSRVFCLVIAAIECMIQPFGTVLGVFTIVVLLRPSVVALFEGHAAATPPMPTQY